MGALFDAKQLIERVVATRNLEPALTLGKIGLKAGFMLAFIKAETPRRRPEAEEAAVGDSRDSRHRNLTRDETCDHFPSP